nr:reverse transcriptase domain-containing protein [Tanacetum cinerariifolium]
MSRQTLGGAARNWFDDLDPKSVEIFEELSQKFMEEFSQQKRYAKDPQKFSASKGGRMRDYKLSWTGSSMKVLTYKEFLWSCISLLLCMVMVIQNLPRSLMTKYPKQWTKCLKGSEPSLGEKWPLGQ